MASIFEKLWRLGPAAFVLKAIFAAIAANGLAARVHSASAGIPETVFCEAGYARLRIAKKMDALISGEIHSSHGDGTLSTGRS